ncbi:cytochrome P450 [Streptomyces sp. HNM0663]|uniref:Cytochrome P450 n=1 Tax=Streptomyces chengmaiensis TaxID=3040919 RepID=A0ABT6HSC8_9ACTN|nr:cytochrome P450 [Streptomyces chengmaiensis]MDH2390784.1 cytochrome P450 [Streptomyces chengmaiensis]
MPQNTTVRSYPPPRRSATDIPGEYVRLREANPAAEVVMPSGDPAFLFSRYDDVRTVLSDSRCSRAATVLPESPKLTAVPFDGGGLFTMDPPEHTRLRSLVAGAFTARRVELLRPRIAELADGLLARMAEQGGPVDFNDAFAFPYPVAVICELLGVPFADRERFRTWSEGIVSLTAHTPEEMLERKLALAGYLQDLAREKRRRPADDLLSALVQVRDEDGPLTEHELITMAMTLLVAGHETTVGVLGASVFTLLRHNGGVKLVPEEPEPLAALVEELLRINPIGDGGPLRVTTQEIEVAGVTVPAGSAVIGAICSANRDGRRFDDPDCFDPARRGGTHLAFGHGPHYCLGAPLARAELQIALSALVRRFPGLRLAVPAEEIRMRAGLLVNRLEALPVEWD